LACPEAGPAGRHLKVGRAWALTERFRTFWAYRYPGAARTFFTRWYWRATHNRLTPLAAVAKLIRRHLPNLLTYLRHRLTNAGLEGVNAVIHWVKKTACGFRNAEHFKTAIYFHCGGLDLSHTEAGRADQSGRRPALVALLAPRLSPSRSDLHRKLAGTRSALLERDPHLRTSSVRSVIDHKESIQRRTGSLAATVSAY
jgi:hypothetical protein